MKINSYICTIKLINKKTMFKTKKALLNKNKQIKVGTFVRYKKNNNFTGGKILSISTGKAKIHNWDGSKVELSITELEYIESWNNAKNII